MKIIYEPSSERGHANHGWLDSYHSFSFADWYNSKKMHFGALRVLNDDMVAAGKGFGTHPHQNMEIVSIPLKGTLAHKDSTGSEGTIKPDEVQIMSAGTGIRHSEFNHSDAEEVKFLQIWVFPKVENITPRYDQKKFEQAGRKNKWQVLVSPNAKSGGLWINQDSVFSRTEMEAQTKTEYITYFQGNVVYLFLISGSIDVNGQVLHTRDAIGVSETDRFEIKALESSDILAIEVPEHR